MPISEEALFNAAVALTAAKMQAGSVNLDAASVANLVEEFGKELADRIGRADRGEPDGDKPRSRSHMSFFGGFNGPGD